MNLVGLAVGMACCLLIGLYVQNELSYNRSRPEADRAVRIVQRTDGGGMARIGDGIMPILQSDLPQVERAVQVERSWSAEQVTRAKGKDARRFEKDGFLFADSAFFDVFAGFELRRGDPETALNRPGTVVLTPEAALLLYQTVETGSSSAKAPPDTYTRLDDKHTRFPPIPRPAGHHVWC